MYKLRKKNAQYRGTVGQSSLEIAPSATGKWSLHLPSPRVRASQEHEWLWGWDETPGIVSVWAEDDGRATIWRRHLKTGELIRDEERFQPWLLLSSLEDLPETGPAARLDVRELEGPGALRYLVSGDNAKRLRDAVLLGASRRLGKRFSSLRDIGDDRVFALPPDEQYLVTTGRNYFRDLSFSQLHRLQFDLETTGLDPTRDRMFMVAVRDPRGQATVLEASGENDASEAELIRQLVRVVQEADPDVIENHNLHGFDLPFLERRARTLGVPLPLGRDGARLRDRAARRGAPMDGDPRRRRRFVAPGRELIDTMDAVMRYDFSTRELPGHGLKVVAKHFGLASETREYIRGDRVAETWRAEPERVRRYATQDVEEVAGIAHLLGGAAFALARMVPRRYERLADAGAATGVIDPLLVRAYLRAGQALPAHSVSDGTTHTGAALHLFAAGVAHRVVKADVASLYPSLMRCYRIGPGRDHLGAMLALVDRLVEQRLRSKALGRAAPRDSAERHTHEAASAAMKLVINSAYGYLAAGGDLTRFADVHAANEVTRRGRELLDFLCRELAARGVTLLEADTDGVYFAVPGTWNEDDERRVVQEVAAQLPELVQLEFEGRYAAMLSHEPKNYALLTYDGRLTLRGVAFRSSRAEPYGEAFLRKAVGCLLRNDVGGVRAAYLAMVEALRARELPTRDVSSRVRLTKTPEQYEVTRQIRRELSYEAMLAAGRTIWRAGERVRVYRNRRGEGRLAPSEDDADPRDYEVEHYLRVLRETYAARLARALKPEDYAVVFGDVDQLSLFGSSLVDVRPVLTPIAGTP